MVTVKALVTSEEFETTKKVVEEFGAGIGKELHMKLNEKAKHKRNWVSISPQLWFTLLYNPVRSVNQDLGFVTWELMLNYSLDMVMHHNLLW